jgi:hypothetical protein
MRLLSKADARAYLERHGIVASQKVSEILDSFDFDKPVYEQPLAPRRRWRARPLVRK